MTPNKKQAMKETELAALIVKWLEDQHWTIYQEVQFSGIRLDAVADIVAVRAGVLWIIETKTAYTLDVLNQAARWPAHYRSVAVPKSRNERDLRVARDYFRVGVLDASEFGEVYEASPAPIFIRNHRTVKGMISQLTDLHKSYAPAGSKSGSHLTPYKQTMIDIRKAIEKNQGCTIKDLYKELGEMHYYSKESFMKNALKCLQDFEGSWCKIDKSVKPFKIYTIEGAPPIHDWQVSDFIQRKPDEK